MTRVIIRALSVLGFVVLIVALLMLAKTTQNSEQFGRFHTLIVLLNAGGLLLLLGLLFINLFRLVRDYIQGVPGARLKSRMIGLFASLAAVPLILVYLFSMYFLNSGIASYFDVDVTRGLDDALTLSQTVLDQRMADRMQHMELLSEEVKDWDASELAAQAAHLRQELQATELVFLSGNNESLASDTDANISLPRFTLSDSVLDQVRGGTPLLDLEPAASGGLWIRAAVRAPGNAPLDNMRVMYARFPVGSEIARLAESVQDTYARHYKLEFQREPLIDSFKLTLTLVLMVSLLLMIWGIFFIARRLVKPIQDLVAGTRAVAAGDFHLQLPEAKKDDIGFLVASFNNMTRRLSYASEVETRSRAAVEAERANLQTILSRLSSGVIALEPDLTVRGVNEATGSILEVTAERFVGLSLEAIESENGIAEQLAAVCSKYLREDKFEWREQIALRSDGGQRILSCACTPLPLGEDGRPSGYVVVFEDVTALLQAQRDAAWGEVARRLAHEIKNPLTPIQLSAERMRRKYLGVMNAHEADVLERATRTIVQQVETMKEMVDAFRDYARAPDIELTMVDLNLLLSETADLYRGGDPMIEFSLKLDPTLPSVEADIGRLRQIIHNLLRNAVEALHHKVNGKIEISTSATTYRSQPVAQVLLEDNGPGIDQEKLSSVFEPYVTSKTKGTGLGLAIVKKIVEEHAGKIHIENRKSGGARVRIILPVSNKSRLALMNDPSVNEPRRETA
ncbi:MAG: HAMP domain-containing protein [Gammaproteobacteria bacterium]|nr:HAMP domain-containing protein [Gammaproteobacteria bacterium]